MFDHDGIQIDSSVQAHLAPFRLLLEDDDVTEIVINGDDQFFFERASKWQRFDPEGDVDDFKIEALGTAVARFSKQTWGESHPLLSASVPMAGARSRPDGRSRDLRLQLIAPPAVPGRQYSITIRKPALVDRTIDDFAKDGLFNRVRPAATGLSAEDTALVDLLSNKHYEEFLRQAVRGRKNIVVAGPTGSGKTTFMKGLIQEIPMDERLITIEDVRELTLPHENKVHLLYSKGNQSSAAVSAKDLLEACLRMKPSRILLAELRGDECLYYVRNAASGHPGSITSVHAGTPALAFEQMAIMIKDSAGGAFLDFEVIKRLLILTVDVVVQFQNQGGERFISEIFFEPGRKLEATK